MDHGLIVSQLEDKEGRSNLRFGEIMVRGVKLNCGVRAGFTVSDLSYFVAYVLF